MNDKQLRKEIDVEIPFRDENGVSGTKSVHVTFISTRIQRAYVAMMRKVYDIIDIFNNINKTQQEIGTVLVDKYDIDFNDDGELQKEKITRKERKAKVRELEAQYEAYNNKLREYDEHFFDEKFNIIEMILRKNQVTDTELLDKEWWMDCVDMHDVMSFIETVCTKDDNLIDQKKKEWSK